MGKSALTEYDKEKLCTIFDLINQKSRLNRDMIDTMKAHLEEQETTLRNMIHINRESIRTITNMLDQLKEDIECLKQDC